jgi:hypothetical protein
MIDYKTIKDFDVDTHEGKLLLAAIAVLSSVDCEDIKSHKWGGMTHPDKAMEQIVELANKIFYEKEWEIEQERIKRDNKINSIINE